MKIKIKSKIISLSILLLCIMLCTVIFGCSDNNGGTFFPCSTDMKQNLKNKNYIVNVVELDGNYSGTYLTAKNESGEYIEFYWLSGPEAVEHFLNILKNEHNDYNHLVSYEEDEKHGNIVFCGTEAAVNDSGIVIVSVKV